MSTRESDIEKLKLIQNKIQTTATNFLSKHNSEKQLFINFILNYKNIIIITVLFIFVLYIIYNSLYSVRINRMINNMALYVKTQRNITHNEEVLSGNFRLCDFYIASAYKCYLPQTNWFDYSSTEAIRQCILYGARYLHLDVFPSSFVSGADPIICNGLEDGNWHWTTKINFEDACKTIAETAFNNQLLANNTDPLFIHLSFKCWGNIETIDKCVSIIKKYFEQLLLSSEYSFNGKYTKSNLALTPIKQLYSKVIIITDSKDNNDIIVSKMHELSNLNPDMTGNCAMMTYEAARDIYNKDELKSDNKRRMTIVYPNFHSRSKQNFNFYTPYYDGCQFLAMNYSEPDQFMRNYINKRFNDYSLLLKPKKLRYKPDLISPPTPQNPEVSFAPRTLTTATYSFNI
jgi:hypothetical protein